MPGATLFRSILGDVNSPLVPNPYPLRHPVMCQYHPRQAVNPSPANSVHPTLCLYSWAVPHVPCRLFGHALPAAVQGRYARHTPDATQAPSPAHSSIVFHNTHISARPSSLSHTQQNDDRSILGTKVAPGIGFLANSAVKQSIRAVSVAAEAVGSRGLSLRLRAACACAQKVFCAWCNYTRTVLKTISRP